MFMLMVCIGFSPLQMLNAGNLGHLETMTDCANGDTDGGDLYDCESVHCPMSAASCGSHNITSIFQEPPGSSMTLISVDAYFCTNSSLYQSHLNFSIYRPPII